MTKPVVTVRDLTKTYGKRNVVDGLSFDVEPGRVTAFLGPNGAGKTTTIRSVLGLVHPDRGITSVLGRPFKELDNPARHVGVLLDDSGFHPQRTARNHLLMLAAAAGVTTQRVAQVLDTVGLAGDGDRRVGGYSLGMRKRLGLAAALLGDPALLILDEPANGLDPAGIRWLRSFLESFAGSGGSAFVSSHLLSEVALLAGDVVVINRGRLVERTTVTQLTRGTTVVLRSPHAARVRRALIARGATAAMHSDEHLEVAGMSIVEVGELAAREGAVLHQLSERAHTLEDVFLELVDSKGGSDVPVQK